MSITVAAARKVVGDYLINRMKFEPDYFVTAESLYDDLAALPDDAVLTALPAAPEPDWSQAPEWAMAHDYTANGVGWWCHPNEWFAHTRSGLTLPLGLDPRNSRYRINRPQEETSENDTPHFLHLNAITGLDEPSSYPITVNPQAIAAIESAADPNTSIVILVTGRSYHVDTPLNELLTTMRAPQEKQ